MNEESVLELTQSLIKKFIINIRQIVSNSDNDIEDILGEAYIVVWDNYERIINNERTFINEMKTKCLRHNKYGRRIESAARWSYFNQLEESLPERMGYTFEINEDLIVGLDTVKQYVSEDEYDFLIFYYENGNSKTSSQYNVSENACRQRVYKLKRKINKEMSGQ